ncbi:alpha/beta hydrolase [Candidatus Bathyarchaeota archaeon]|nr:alpha/beta hydrolase [Candidatus Bathyarchaeota archaeon]
MNTEVWNIFSNYLEEEREILVYKPSLLDNESAYPTLYLLDGDINFTCFSGIVDYYIRTYRIPPIIVIGISSTDRRRDFSYYTSFKSSNSTNINFGIENFTKFLKTELIPKVESTYNIIPYRVITGHSLSGSYVIHLLLNHNYLFNSYIALSPFFKQNFSLLLDKARMLYTSKNPYRLFFIGEEKTSDERFLNTLEFLKVIKKVPNIETEYRRYVDADHMSIIVKSVPDALDYIFPGTIQDR